MAVNYELAKRYAAEQFLKLALYLIERNPDKNFIKLLNLLDKIAQRGEHHQQIRALKQGYLDNPVIGQYLKKLTEIAPSYKTGLLVNFLINASLLGIPYQYKMAEELGVMVPWAILLDPISICNLKCRGCWAGQYSKSDTLAYQTIDRIISEAKELGIYFIIFSGGEPTLYPDLLKLCQKHSDVGFVMFTNGTLIDREIVDQMVETGNLSPAISLEGFRESTDHRRGQGVYDQVMELMDRLREKGVVFGSSITVNRNNAEELFAGDDFIDLMVKKGAAYTWSFHYIPIGSDPDLELMITPGQRSMLARRVPELRKEKPLFILDFWNDGTYSGGCIAGGRRYFHINARGDVEPCAFVHFAADNIKGKSLKEVLQNPLFKAYQERQPFNENLMLPCPIIDNPLALREMVAETGAAPTHRGADGILQNKVANRLERIAGEWAEKAQPILEERLAKPDSQYNSL